jgi:hypothetical protein
MEILCIPPLVKPINFYTGVSGPPMGFLPILPWVMQGDIPGINSRATLKGFQSLVRNLLFPDLVVYESKYWARIF